MRTRGKRVAWLAGAVTIALLIGAGIANQKRIREQWWLYKFRNGDGDTQAAAEKLGELGSLEVVPELLALASGISPWPQHRNRVVMLHWSATEGWAPDTLRVIGEHGNPEGLPLWIDALENGVPRVRLVAADAIRRLGASGESAIPALIRAVHDERGHWPPYINVWLPKSSPRSAAASALWNLGEAGKTALSQALENATEEVRKDVETVLSGMSP